MGRGRLTHIDGLRGIAAVMVLLQHVAERVTHAGVPSAALQAGLAFVFQGRNSVGQFGVACFFLISGFVIPFSLAGQRPLRDFALGRVLRLYPAYWVSLAATIIVLAAIGDAPPAWRVAANVTMVQRLIGRYDLLSTYWTLAIEIVFYALAAVLFRTGILGNGRCVALLSALLLAFSLVTSAWITGFLALMLLGTAWRRAMIDHAGPPAGLTLLHLLASPFMLPSSGIAFAAYAPAILLFVIVIHRARPAGVLALFFGRLSYSLYLIHGVWLLAALHWLPPAGDWASALCFTGVVCGGSIGSALLLFYGVEQPCMALAKRLRGWSPIMVRGARFQAPRTAP